MLKLTKNILVKYIYFKLKYLRKCHIKLKNIFS